MNDMVTLTFKRSGLRTSVQDLGRTGYQHFGIPRGGAMDRASAKIANMLVENEPGTPVLEMTLMGPEIHFEGECQIALTGADISPSVNEAEAPMYETISVKDGDVLSFDGLKWGCRAYLAVRGTWQAVSWLGSCSASSCNWMALTPDSIIKKENRLVIHTKPPIQKKRYPEADIPAFNKRIAVKILPGPEFGVFSDDVLSHFFGHSHRVAIESDRMGYRLDINIPGFVPPPEIISSGIIPGTIQITNAGQPVILMVDAQTTGGYPRLGNILTDDIDRVAQLRPADEIQFSLLR